MTTSSVFPFIAFSFLINEINTSFVLGLFAPSHVPYEVDRADKTDPKGAPSIEEMTEKAIRFLLKKGGDQVRSRKSLTHNIRLVLNEFV